MPDQHERPWGAVPVRAAGDPRLSSSHFRVLVVIARRAGKGRNGSGCFATHETLAAETGLARPTVSTAISELVRMGYLEARPRPGRKRRQLFVCYRELSSVDDKTTARIVSDGVPNAHERLSAGDDERLSAVADTEETREGEHAEDGRESFVVRKTFGGQVDVERTAMALRRLAARRALTLQEWAWLDVEAEIEEGPVLKVIGDALALHAERGGPDYLDQRSASDGR